MARVLSGRVIAIVRLSAADYLIEAAEALVRGGIRSLEFTLTTPGALPAIERCRQVFGESVVVGAGTVLTVEDVDRCGDAGAQFIVSPGYDAAVIERTHESGMISLPGAMTPTEILEAWRCGADAVKVFPARSLGPRYIADIRAPLPHIPLIPTGGVDAHNAAEYLRAGAVAVAVGGNLVSASAVAAGDWATLEQSARELVAAAGKE